MVISHKDWELLDLKSDLYVVESHLHFVEEQIPFQTQKHEYELDNKLKLADYDPSCEVERAMEWDEIQDHQQWVREGLPRLVVNPFVVTVWALYEAAISDFADIVQKKQGAALALSDITGKHLVDRVDKYFRHVLHFPIDYSADRMERLNFLGALRNSIVHNNGKMSGLKKSIQTRIESDEIEGVSASDYRVYIILEVEYARQAFETVKEHLLLLFKRYETL